MSKELVLIICSYDKKSEQIMLACCGVISENPGWDFFLQYIQPFNAASLLSLDGMYLEAARRSGNLQKGFHISL